MDRRSNDPTERNKRGDGIGGGPNGEGGGVNKTGQGGPDNFGWHGVRTYSLLTALDSRRICQTFQLLGVKSIKSRL